MKRTLAWLGLFIVSTLLVFGSLGLGAALQLLAQNGWRP